MSGDPLTPIWTRLECEQPVFFADRPDPAFGAARDRLLGLGYVRPVEAGRFAVCVECGGGHVRLVAWAEDVRTGTRRAFVPCPECGAVPIDPAALRRWEVDVGRLLADVFRASGGRVAVGERVPGRLWHLGAATWAGHSRQAYFARFVHGPARAAVLAALAPHPRAVLFHPTEHAVRAWADATPNLAVGLESVVTLGPAGLVFDAAAVEGRLADAGFGTPAPKKPARRRASRAAAIERLVRELREHLRAAREHALATQQMTGTPELLPRPTQEDLAAATGLSPSAVSRCLADPSARELKLYWGSAADLDCVLRRGDRPASDE